MDQREYTLFEENYAEKYPEREKIFFDDGIFLYNDQNKKKICVFCKNYPSESSITQIINKLHSISLSPHPIETNDYLKILEVMDKDDIKECEYYISTKNVVREIRIIHQDKQYMNHLLKMMK